VNSITALLRAYDLHPKKGLGQHFLADQAALGQIVAAADLTPTDTVLEIGPGLGTLTSLLAERAGRVVAVELDDRLAAILAERLADRPNVEVCPGNILRISDFASLVGPSYKVVANLPYYITSAVLRHLLERHDQPSLLVVTVQREVAERIVAVPPDMSLLAVSVQFYGRPSLVARIPAGAFYPPPKVDSAVVRIDVLGEPAVSLGGASASPEGDLCEAPGPGVSVADFFRVVRAGFGHKRKTLRNALSAGLGLAPACVEQALAQAGIDPRRRAETLSLQEWADLVLPIRLAG
jgi:16S rRNA (adenine1518-N6/adenine1519-N6)-dimethyltransferase